MSKETAEKVIVQLTALSRLQDNLQALLCDLRSNGYKVGIDQYLSAQTLFINWQQQTVTQQTLRASLGALFSTSPDEQQRFTGIFQNWYQQYAEQATLQAKTVERLSKPPKWSEIPKINRRQRWLVGLSVLIVTFFIQWLIESAQIDHSLKGTDKPPTSLSNKKTIGSKGTVDTQLFIPAPHMPAEPVIAPASYRHWSHFLLYFQGLLLLAFIFWFALQLKQRYLTLSRRHSQTDQPKRLESLHLKQSLIDLFPALALKPVLQTWRSFLPFRSHRLNESATVQETILSNGYVQMVYKQRLLPPEYVLLIDRRHTDDYTAWLGAELQQRLQQQGLFVSCYRYDVDPRYCWAMRGASRCYSIDQLADRHQGQKLLVIGEAAAFYRGREQRQIDWGSDAAWIDKTLLSINTPDDWGNHERKLMQAGFRITPFTRRGLLQLIDKVQPKLAEQFIDGARSLDYRDAPLPSVLRSYAADWLEEQRPSRQHRKTILSALKTYLGFEGYRLLAAMAAYPALDWRLTLALDVQLQQREGEEREIRLRKLSRLPWLRSGRLPDVWRKDLIRSLDKAMLIQINEAYQALLNYEGSQAMDLPVAIPDYPSAKAAQNERINTAKQGEPLQDTVFASVIRGRKPSLLEFTLPRAIKNWMPPEYWRGLFNSTTVAVLLLTASLSFGFNAVWEHWGANWQQDSMNQSMQANLAAYQIKVIYTDKALGFHAQTLQERLQLWGFKSTIELQNADSASTPTTESADFALDANRINYSAALPDSVLQIAKQRLRYLTFGASVVELKDEAMADKQIIITLQKAYQPLSVYRDAIQQKLLLNSKRDKLKDGSLGPAMIKIEPGCFQMGSPESEKYRSNDEGPQHKVCIQQVFYLGQYEVTFAEYDLFSDETKRRLPSDRDWGRGDRPVMNVSWKEAVAYIEWLSGQTGRHYRLPTEAEWEYAARAKITKITEEPATTTSVYWWGDAIEKGMAVCNGCGSRGDNPQTVPVGSFAPNAFGLYDTAGNVMEWIGDCWHKNYEGAPSDGSAWEDLNQGDCGRRVLRGGSWSSDPRDVRSANRSRYRPNIGLHNMGFRLAQDFK